MSSDEEYIDVRQLPGSKEVYIVKEAGYFPVLTAVSDRELIAVFRSGAGHLGIEGRLDVARSEDAGDSWSAPMVVADSARDDRNPALGIAEGGVIVLAYHAQGGYEADGKFSHRIRNVDMCVTRSHDGGITWEEPYLLSFEPLRSHSAYGKILTLPDGALLMPIYGQATGVLDCEVDVRSQSKCLSYLLRSEDKGLTWGKPSVVGADLSEGAYLLLPNGELFGILRSANEEQGLHACRSTDAGYTWTKPQRITEPLEHPGDLVLLPNNHVLLAFGRRRPPYGVQGMISPDGGRSWDERRLLFCDDRPGRDCGYPSSVRLPGRQLAEGGPSSVSNRIITAYYSAGDHQDAYRGDGAFARAVVYEESELLASL